MTFNNGTDGDDEIYGTGSSYIVNGNAGNDSLGINGGSNNTFNGGSGRDSLYIQGNGAVNILNGDDGDDILSVYNGHHNTLNGGSVNDTLFSAGYGDTLNGGDFDDNLSVIRDISGIPDYNLSVMADKYGTLYGHGHALYGGSGNDTLYSFAIKSSLYGGNGNDVLKSSGYFDFMNGGSGVDQFEVSFAYGHSYYSTINDFDPLQDKISAKLRNPLDGLEISLVEDWEIIGSTMKITEKNSSTTLISWKSGNSLGNWDVMIVLNNVNKADITKDNFIGFEDTPENAVPIANADTATTTETAMITGNVLTNDTDSDNDPLTVSQVNSEAGNVGSQIILASGALLTLGADGTYSYNPNGQFNSLNHGQSATDTFTYEASDGKGGASTATVTVTINGENDIIPVNIIKGNKDKNTLFGTIANDKIYGFGNDDSLYGGDGDDKLYGGEGNDTIWGGLGNDLIEAGEGRDSLIGEAGDDIIYGRAGNDFIDGNNGNDKLYGGDDSDIITGGLGKDLLDGGSGADFLYGGLGNDKIHGRAGNDIIFGDNGYDTLYGGEGNDTITGGLNRDILWGGTGNDTFIFNAVADSRKEINFATLQDRIDDFETGVDKIILSDAIVSSVDDITISNINDMWELTVTGNDFAVFSTQEITLSDIQIDFA